MRSLLLTVHVLAVAAWIGGGLFGSITFTHLATRIGLKQVLALDQRIGARYFGTAVGLVVLSGVGLVLVSDSFGWSHAFVLVGIGVVVADGVIEGALVGPRMRRLAEAEEPDLARYRGMTRLAALTHLALLAIATWAMVVKLGA